MQVELTPTDIDYLERTITTLRNRSVSEYSTAAEKELARYELGFCRDLVARIGLSVTFSLRGKCEIRKVERLDLR